MLKKIIVIVLTINASVFSQAISISNLEKINSDKVEKCFYPKFNSDNSEIIFSTENYKGLYSIELNTNQTKVISEDNGVGYKPLLIDNKIIFRNFQFVQGKKYHSVFMEDLTSQTVETIETNKRRLSIPTQTISNSLMLIDNSKVSEKNISVNKLAKTNQTQLAVYSENNQLILVKNGNEIDLSPMGKGVYVWESFSHDGSKIIFSYQNQGTFICDLDGNILQNIKDARYASFSPDDNYVLFMRDKDNGERYISSDVFIYSLENNTAYNLTNSKDKIEMYPEWSHDQNSITYNTTDGNIYIAKINFEK